MKRATLSTTQNHNKNPFPLNTLIKQHTYIDPHADKKIFGVVVFISQNASIPQLSNKILLKKNEVNR